MQMRLRGNFSMQHGLGRPPRVAVIGCGWFAQVAHLPILRQLHLEGIVELVALCSRSNESIKIGQQILGWPIKTYTTIEEIVAQEEIDVVDLILPTPIMKEAIYKSFAAGKNVISEKPCATNTAECKELISFYKLHQDRLSWSVAENWPFKPTVQTVLKILKKGILGQIKNINFRHTTLGYQNYSGWRNNFPGGYILDSGVHFISMLRLISGGIVEVDASVGWKSPHFIADRVEAEIFFENDIKGNFVVSFSEHTEPHNNNQLWVECQNGVIQADFVNGRVVLESGGTTKIIDTPDDPWVQGGIYSMLRHFCKSVSDGTPSMYSPIEGMKDVAVVDAMIESSRLMRRVMPSVFHSELNGSGAELQTFSDLNNFKPRHSVETRSFSEVRRAIREAASQGLKVRPIGMGNSWSQYVKTADVSLATKGLDFISKIDKWKKTIRIGSGIRLGEITKNLSEQGMCLPSIPFLTDATIGGAVATATHGTSPHWGTVSDLIQSIKLITSSGDLIQIDGKNNSRLLPAAKVSIGMLGVIVELELKVVEMPWVRNVQFDTSLDEFLNFRSALFVRYEHIWIHWILGGERLIIQCLETRPTKEDGFVPYASDERANWVMAYHATPTYSANEDIMLSMQYGLHLDLMSEAMRLINRSAFGLKNKGREIEIKFLKKDSGSFLGPNTSRDMALFNTWWPTHRNSYETIFVDLEQCMRDLNARPHWGKFHRPSSAEYMYKTYPEWENFDKIRRELDPIGMFDIF